MSWDFRTVQGPESIFNFINGSPQDSRIIAVNVDKSAAHKVPQATTLGGLETIQAFLNIETSSGRGEGLVRLILDTKDDGTYKAFTLFTTLKELKGHEESIQNRRPTGLHRNDVEGSLNWKDRLLAQQNFEGDREPTVLIIGRLPRVTLFMKLRIC